MPDAELVGGKHDGKVMTVDNTPDLIEMQETSRPPCVYFRFGFTRQGRLRYMIEGTESIA